MRQTSEFNDTLSNFSRTLGYKKFITFNIVGMHISLTCSLVGCWLVVLIINVDLAIFQPYLDLEAGDN